MTSEEFNHLISICQPHSLFNLDWQTYYAVDFADTFLPDVHLYVNKGVKMYDGALLFADIQKSGSEIFALSEGGKLINLIAYSYPKGVEAGNKKERVEPRNDETCIFIEIQENDDIEIFFRAGTDFRSFLDSYYQKNNLPGSSFAALTTTYKTTSAEFKQFFNRDITHAKMARFMFNTLGIIIEQQPEIDYRQKLIQVLSANHIEGFVYHNKMAVDGAQLDVAIGGKPGVGGLDVTISTQASQRQQGGDAKQQLPQQYLAVRYEHTALPVIYTNNVDDHLSEGAVNINADGKPTIGPQIYQQVLNQFTQAGFTEQPQGQGGNKVDFEAITRKIADQLSNPFYSNVKLQVNIVQQDNTTPSNNKQAPKPLEGGMVRLPGSQATISNSAILQNYDNKSDYDLLLDVLVKPDGSMVIKHHASEKYLHEYVDIVQKYADKRGINIKAEDLRQQVISDFESSEVEDGFFNSFIKGSQNLLEDQLAGYVEGIQAVGKISKNVWQEGNVNQSLWWQSKYTDEYKQWPAYLHAPPVVYGGADGVIDEVVGIPMAIKGVYEIATDKEKRKALAGLFSSEGLTNLYDGLKKEVSDVKNDPEKGQHFCGQTTVAVIFMFSPEGLISETGKMSEVLGVITKDAEKLVNPKILNALQRLREAEKFSPNIYKAIKEFLEKIDPKILDKLADAPGFEQVIKDMGVSWEKFQGGEFVLKYASKMVGLGKVIKFEVSSLSDEARRIYDITYEVVGHDGQKLTKYLELKNWSGFWPDTIRKQFIKDLENMSELGERVWIFSKKGINQDIDKLRENVIKALKKDGAPVDELNTLVSDLSRSTKLGRVLGKQISHASDVIDALDDKKIFEQIFEIVE